MTDQDLKIDTSGIQTDDKHSYYNHRYEPTSYTRLEKLFDELPLDSSAAFVDYGCGKGRINFYVHHRFHCHSIGIDLNQAYYEDCIRNLATYTGGYKQRLQFHCIPAQHYVLQGFETHFYFFNPFSIEIFRKVIQSIYVSIEQHPRDCVLILYYSDDEYLYYIENETGLTLIQEIKQLEHSKDDRERFCIYRF